MSMEAGADIERVVTAALEALGESFELLDCGPELADTVNFCAHYQNPPENSGNTIIVASKKEIAALSDFIFGSTPC